MVGVEFGKELPGVAYFALLGLFEALANTLVSVRAGSHVEQALIGFCVLKQFCTLLQRCYGSPPWPPHRPKYLAFATRA
jgi:hypothetical protein